MNCKYKTPEELIGVEFEESGQTYKITGIGETTEKFMTLFTEKLKAPNIINWNGKLLIDIGHGGTKALSSGKKVTDYGAVNSASGMSEFIWNKDFIENYLVSELNNAGIKHQIILRTDGTTKLVQDLNRVAGKDDIILSFHLNSAGATATGTETLYWHTSAKGKKLAEIVQKGLTGVLGLPDRGIKIRRKPLNDADALNQRGWTMFRDTKVPFVMLESFFISNNKDLQIGTQRKAELARAVITAIKEYIK